MTEPDHLSQESTKKLLENVTRYVIPESCGNIAYSIVSAKRDAFRDVSIICKTRVTSVTVMDIPLGNAIDKKLLSTINKILIDKLSIRSFCY